MFWERYSNLCDRDKVTPNGIAKIIGVSNATCTKWKNGAIPTGDTLLLVAKHFDCSVDYLLGRTENPKSHTCSVATGDISLSNNSVVGDGQVGVTIHNGYDIDKQVAALIDSFNKLDPYKQAEALLYVKNLSKSE